jgi:hypothetical protein
MEKRLQKKIERLTTTINDIQTLSLRELSSCRKEEVQYGRFVSNKKVSVEALAQELYSKMQSNCIGNHCLLI